jgi:hypothetical protein
MNIRIVVTALISGVGLLSTVIASAAPPSKTSFDVENARYAQCSMKAEGPSAMRHSGARRSGVTYRASFRTPVGPPDQTFGQLIRWKVHLEVRHTQQLTVQRLIIQADSVARLRRHAPRRVRDEKNGDLGFGQMAVLSDGSQRDSGYFDERLRCSTLAVHALLPRRSTSAARPMSAQRWPKPTRFRSA